MDMADTGLAISGTAFGVIGTVATAFIRARLSGLKKGAPERVKVSPDPLRVELQREYATKMELRDVEDRLDRRMIAALGTMREDFKELRQDIKENDEKAEARASATHKRIDAVKDMCASRGSCK